MHVETIQDPKNATEIHAAVRRGIREADPPDVPARDWNLVTLALRDEDAAVRGGLIGATMWAWLLIDGLWVDQTLRGRGFGRQLLLAAEALAVERGCRGAWLGTFDFQARAFYERHGYRVFGEIAGFPHGHLHFHLSKVFGVATAG